MSREKKLLTKKEIPSYQLALRCLRHLRSKHGIRALHGDVENVKDLAREIRAYRNEERRTN